MSEYSVEWFAEDIGLIMAKSTAALAARGVSTMYLHIWRDRKLRLLATF
ncbi:hypothetical protein LCM00_12315 [Bacillus infantis]|nr:hypothetical protein [Bacillus infantis]MCA1040288.1 hypothetical protein [Bacillus infantis]